MKISILGAGAWGTALAVQAAARHEVRLWARDAAACAQMAQTRRNARYLPDTVLPERLRLDSDLDAAIAHGHDSGAGLIVVATPMAALRSMLARLPHGARGPWLCKGFDARTRLLGPQITPHVQP